MTLVSIGIGLEVFKILRFLLLLETLGPIVICIIRVAGDALRISVIYAIIFAAHALCAWCMFKPYQKKQNEHPECPSTYSLAQPEKEIETNRGLFHAMWFRILSADGDPKKILIKQDGSDLPFSHEFSHLMGIAMWAVYQITICILMINLLIAIMNNTYSEVWQRADVEWKYSKSYYQVTFQQMYILLN